ncbi:MAG: hypothetical protein JST08_03045 [Actinobacteria bacterium]|nr:hypothetical protein [Actinomycetota bacterium]
MRRNRWTALRRGAIGALLALAVVPAVTLAAGGGSSAVTPGEQGQGPVNTCFWGRPAANVGPINHLNVQVGNVAGFESNVVYYYTLFQLPAGATITLHGQFPHARYFSLTSYVTKSGVTGYPATSIYDEQIEPDAGSVNPFMPGADRQAADRDYTITVSGETQPASPAPNTLYAGQAGQTGQTQQIELIMRIYRPDKNLEANAGVPLAAPTLNPSGGSPVTQEKAVCEALSTVSGIGNLPTASQGLPPATYQHLRDLGSPVHPATPTPTWERFFNQQHMLAPLYAGAGEPYESLIPKLPTTVTGGFYSTPSNAYITSYVDRNIGPNTEGHNIVVLHAKMPTHPTTYEGDPVNDSTGTQVRYWSLCTAGSISNPPLIPANSACLFDQQVPTDAADEYTIVVSLPEDRPKNATPACGVAWLDWGTAGDGQGRPSLDLLIMRNQLSSPTFAQSIERITTPGTEQEVMGAYYPTTTYETTQEFEAKGGCSTPATPAPSAAPAPAPAPAGGWFAIKQVTHNTKKGTARLGVDFTGSGKVTMTGKGIKSVDRTAGTGTGELTVVPGNSLKAKLTQAGQAKVKVTVSFETAGNVWTKTKTISLRLKK